MHPVARARRRVIPDAAASRQIFPVSLRRRLAIPRPNIHQPGLHHLAHPGSTGVRNRAWTHGVFHLETAAEPEANIPLVPRRIDKKFITDRAERRQPPLTYRPDLDPIDVDLERKRSAVVVPLKLRPPIGLRPVTSDKN